MNCPHCQQTTLLLQDRTSRDQNCVYQCDNHSPVIYRFVVSGVNQDYHNEVYIIPYKQQLYAVRIGNVAPVFRVQLLEEVAEEMQDPKTTRSFQVKEDIASFPQAPKLHPDTVLNKLQTILTFL